MERYIRIAHHPSQWHLGNAYSLATDLLVYRKGFLGHGFPRQFAGSELAHRVFHRMSKLSVCECRLEGLRQRLHIPGLCQQTMHAILDSLCDAANPACYDRLIEGDCRHQYSALKIGRASCRERG